MKHLSALLAVAAVFSGNLLGGAAHAQPRATAATGSVANGPVAKASDGFSRAMDTQICTTAPRSAWLPEDEMRLLAEHRGYRIKTFRIDKNNCYEVYGFDRQNRVVEAYFDPTTSRLLHQNTAN